MSATCPINVPSLLLIAEDEACRWRGWCIDQFARAERSVTDALLHFYSIDGQTAGRTPTRMPQLTGQRFTTLAERVDRCPHGANRQRAAIRLARFREHESLRPLLCHGRRTVFVTGGGDWLLRLEMVEFQANKPLPRDRTLSRADAEALASTLERSAKQLDSALRANGLYD